MKRFLVSLFTLQPLLADVGVDGRYAPAGLRIPTEWTAKVTPENVKEVARASSRSDSISLTIPEPEPMAELKTMIDTLHNHPSIVQWVPFNEAWGQHRTPEVGKWAVAYDPTRHINVASGGNFFPVGYIVDAHLYPHPDFPFDQGNGGRFDDFVKVIGEFGGHGLSVPGHMWNPKDKSWGYGELAKEEDAWLARNRTSIEKLAELRKRGIAAGIYTQTSDVEGEINGILTYDRRVKKATAETLAEIHREAGF